MDYSAVLFDLDGTLLDTLRDLADSANAVLDRHGFPTHPVAKYRQLIGAGVEALFTQALPPGTAQPDRMGPLADEFRDIYAARWNVHTRPYPQIPELLDALADRSARMAVLSNKPHAFTTRCVAEFLPGKNLEVVLGQRDSVPRKPDPAGALEVADTLGVPANRFLYLGDSAIDMQTARRAGMVPIGALWGFRSRDELETGGAERLIQRPLELLDWWDRQSGTTSPGDPT